MPVVDVPIGEFGRGLHRVVGILDTMVLFELRLQPQQDLHRLRHRGLGDIDLLEAPRQRVVLLEDAPILLVGCRADAANLAVREHGLDQVRSIHDAARGGPRADHGVNLVNEQDRAGLLLELRDHRLQALFEISAVLGTGDQRAHVQRVDGAVGQHLGHPALDDQARQALGDRGLADSGLPDVQRVVLAPAAQDLDGALDLELAPDQRIDASFLGLGIEVDGELLERAARLAVALALDSGIVALLFSLRLAGAREPMRYEVHDIEPCDLGAREQEHCVALLFAENRDQHVDHADFFLAARLHVKHRALQHALEAQRRLDLALLAEGKARRIGLDVRFQIRAQALQIGTAAFENLAHLGGIEDREQQMLDRKEFMTRAARLMKGLIKTKLQLARQHCSISPADVSGLLERAQQRVLMLARVTGYL